MAVFSIRGCLRRLGVLAGLVGLLLPCMPARALIQVGWGNAPVNDYGWPAGSLEVANLKCRVGWWEGPPFGGGQWEFLYRGDAETLNAALKAFAAIRAPALEIIVRDGPHSIVFLKDPKDPKADTRVDWTFTVWVPASFHRLFNNPKTVWGADRPGFRQEVDPPRLVIYIGGGAVEWAKVKLPEGVRVIDERASASALAPEAGSVVEGSVWDMATGKPVADATVTVETRADSGQWQSVARGTSDAQGRFRIEKIPAGTCRVVADANGYAPRSMGYQQFTEHGLRRMQIHLAAGAKLAGLVTGPGGKPLEGVKVSVGSALGLDGRGYPAPLSADATTDAEGRFALAGLPTGYIQLHAQLAGYHHDNMLEIFDVPGREAAMRMKGTGTVRGKVVGPDGAAVGGGDVSIYPEGELIGKWGGGMHVKPDGTFEFTGVPEGTYYVSIDSLAGRTGTDPGAKKIEVEAGKTLEVEVSAGRR